MLYSLLGSCDLTDAVHLKTLNESTLILKVIQKNQLDATIIIY